MVPVAATSGAATAVVLRETVVQPPDPATVPDEQTPLAGTAVVSDLRAADPDTAAAPWTLRVARSKTGFTCTTVGQVQDNVFGLTGLDGVFRRLPGELSDACGQGGTLTGVRVLAADRATRRAVGRLRRRGRHLRTATLLTATGDRTAEARRRRDLRRRTARVPRGPHGVAAPHVRGRPQRTPQAQRRPPDRSPTPRARRRGRSRGTRWAPAGGARSSTRRGWAARNACRARPPASALRTSERTWVADARLLRTGERGVPGFDRWSWRGTPDRTVVWGVARTNDAVRSVVLRGAGAPRPVAVSEEGAFAAVLPPTDEARGPAPGGHAQRRHRAARPARRGPHPRPRQVQESAMIARLAVAAALVGSAVGAAVVLADEPAPTARPAVPGREGPSSRPRSRRPEPIEARNPRSSLEVPDPKGAAPWAVRRFETTFTSAQGQADTGARVTSRAPAGRDVRLGRHRRARSRPRNPAAPG